jgi:hypothetical protein
MGSCLLLLLQLQLPLLGMSFFLLMAMLQMAADSVRKKKTWAPWRRLS